MNIWYIIWGVVSISWGSIILGYLAISMIIDFINGIKDIIKNRK